MGFLDLFKKKVSLAESKQKLNSSGEPLDRLVDGELPWGWITAYADFYRPRDKKLLDLSTAAANAKSIDDEIARLKEFISFYYQYKNECISNGECYFKYFSDMHMHCHNSRNPDFDFVVPREERLEYLLKNYDSLIDKEKEEHTKEAKKQALLKGMNLEKSIRNIVVSNPGILQSDVYQKFDPVLKDSISELLYYAAKNGKIRREKCGRSYQLFWEA